MGTFTQQTRYNSEDLMLAADPDVFSRFMITPMRDGKIGSDAIASGGLGAFLGFACPAFMRHDYLLGRMNCQTFLKSTFVLHEDNPVFNAAWSNQQKQDLGITIDGERFLPIVPVLGDAAVPEATDPWPRHRLNPETYRDGIEKRFKAIVEFEGSGGLISGMAAWLLAHLGQGKVSDLVVKAMNDALTQAGLN
jgi:hypothetical protein